MSDAREVLEKLRKQLINRRSRFVSSEAYAWDRGDNESAEMYSVLNDEDQYVIDLVTGFIAGLDDPKPCPWCGDKPIRRIYNKMYYYVCINDFCPTRPVSTPKADEAEALAMWNTRVEK